MKVIFSNANIASNGVASIPFPIPKAEYDNCLSILAALDIGDVLAPDCKVEEISDEYPILKQLEGSIVNVDELDYLVKRLESFDKRELGQFSALAVTQDIHSMKDYINLTFCCQNITVVQDFSKLEQIGSFCHMDRNGGTMSQGDMLHMDFKKVALNLLQNETGKVTPYGVIYDKDFQMEQLYDGRHFPQYHYEDCVMEMEVFDEQISAQEQPLLYLNLPMTDLQLQRALERGELHDKNIVMIIADTNLPHQAIPVIDFEGEKIADVNSLCQIISKLSNEDCLKMDAAILFTLPNDAKELCNLAEQLDLFDFVPSIRTAEEYGKHMIMESGKFECDDNLADYYNFEKYGTERIAQEHGQFNDGGYISYHGVVSIEELLAGVDCERMDTGMQMQ